MISVRIITVTKSKDSNGQSDTAWLLFWNSLEASVAVIAVSINAFRTLFISATSSRRRQPIPETRSCHESLAEKAPRDRLPSMPSATFPGMRGLIREGPTMKSKHGLCSRPLMEGTGSRVTQEASIELVRKKTCRDSCSLTSYD